MEYSSNNRRGGNRHHWYNKKNGNDNKRSDLSRDANRNFESKRFDSKSNTKLPQQVQDDMKKDQQAIREIKQNQHICPCCNKLIYEITTALADQKTGEPVHFDCVLEQLQQTETLKQNEKITYIGQGRFAIVYFPNIHDTRHFNIVRIIEWESKDKKYPWREDISSVFSQVH